MEDKVVILKSHAYDILVNIEQLQLELRKTNQAIVEEQSKPKDSQGI